MASDAELCAADVDELQTWFEENPNLPKAIDRILLRRFYQCMYGDMDEVKQLIEVNYAIRNKHEDIFLKRDPADEGCKNSFEYADMLALPGLTPEKYKISCYRLRDEDPNRMHYIEDVKAFLMFTDCRFSLPDEEDTDTLSYGEIQIFDLKGSTLKHVTKFKISIFRIYVKFLQEGYPVRLRAVHIINCPTFVDKVLRIIKPFIHKEVYKLINLHTDDLESLYKCVPRDMLPEEYGGKAGKFLDLKEQTWRTLAEKRDYLMDSAHWKIDSVS